MGIDGGFIKGIDLFNQGKFFEAHEELEKIWLKDTSELRDFYKGIIQAAVALHHLKRRNLSGAASLVDSSVAYLEKYDSKTLDVDVQAFIKDVKHCFSEAASNKPFQAPKIQYAKKGQA